MDNIKTKNNPIFYILVFLSIFLSIFLTFYKFIILKDYQIMAQVSCDPTTEKCFVIECNHEDEECLINPEESTTYYKIISKNAGVIHSCQSTVDKNGCNEELSCIEGEERCEYTFCDLENLPDGETCSE